MRHKLILKKKILKEFLLHTRSERGKRKKNNSKKKYKKTLVTREITKKIRNMCVYKKKKKIKLHFLYYSEIVVVFSCIVYK